MTVNFSDVVTYDEVSAEVLKVSAADTSDEPKTWQEQTWDLTINAVSFLADHYGADRDDFIPSVLALTMPTLLESKTTLNPEGAMDLVDQGIWGRPWNGVQVWGVRDAARKVARGNYDEWMLGTWVEDNEGDPVGVLDGLIEGLNFWASDVAADLEYRALGEIDALIARAQKIEGATIEDAKELMPDPVTEQQINYLCCKMGYERREVEHLTEGEAHIIIFGDGLDVVSVEIRAHADQIWSALKEYQAHVPGAEKDAEPAPQFLYEPQRSDELERRIAESTIESFLSEVPKAAPFKDVLYRALVDGGDFGDAGVEKAVKQHGLDKRVKAAREASSTNAGFQQIELEVIKAEKMAETILSAEMDTQSSYLKPEYPFDYENVSCALSRIQMHTDVVSTLKEIVARLREGWREMKLAFSDAWTATGDKDALWNRYKVLKLRYQALRDHSLEQMTEKLAGIPREFLFGMSPTEESALCNALAGEVGRYFDLVREAAADALDLDLDDDDVWGRLYPEGTLGDEYESLLPGADREAVDEFLSLVTERVPTNDLTWEYWDTEPARKAHVGAALHRQSWSVSANEGRSAFWALSKDERNEMLAAARLALKDVGLRRAKVNGRWKVVNQAGDIVTMAERQQKQDAASRQVVQVKVLKRTGISDSNGAFIHWGELAGGLGRHIELAFESQEKKASFAAAVAGLQNVYAQRVAEMLQ